MPVDSHIQLVINVDFGAEPVAGHVRTARAPVERSPAGWSWPRRWRTRCD
jgi:hypothetical protein